MYYIRSGIRKNRNVYKRMLACSKHFEIYTDVCFASGCIVVALGYLLLYAMSQTFALISYLVYEFEFALGVQNHIASAESYHRVLLIGISYFAPWWICK